MRHLKKGKKFGRVRKQRQALIKHLANALILNEKIQTTEAKAKTLRPYVEKLITKSKSYNLGVKRELYRVISKTAAKKAIDILGPKYKDKAGGYTRIMKLPPRLSDGAKVAVIEFV